MNHEQLLLERLDAIGRSVAESGHGLALIGLGSVGLEQERLDAHSDLDFFVIVEDGHKAAYLNDLVWLERIAPVAYRFQNTEDGFKLLFVDDVFCEFAVFELPELNGIPFAAGRIVWKRAHVDDAIATPSLNIPERSSHNLEWELGEALTNLYIGLKRFNRGEKLSGSRFVQQYALDRVLGLAERIEPEQPAFRDAFNIERRFEQRFPRTAQHLQDFVQGYERTPESALAILEFLEKHFAVNAGMAATIRRLANT
jgi:lincosamide nucleotidyltransferase B/F